MKTPIKLGQKSPEIPCCPTSSSEHFPSVYLTGKEFEDMPESGTMTVRFKRNSKNTSEREGKTHVDVSVDLTEVVSVESDKPEADSDDTASALDRLRDELLKEKE